jgi:hypothetical protein
MKVFRLQKITLSPLRLLTKLLTFFPWLFSGHELSTDGLLKLQGFLFRPVLGLNRCNISGELYLILLVTCPLKSLIAISQNRIASKYIKQNETENQ